MPDQQPFSQYIGVIVQVDAPGLTQPFTYGVPDGLNLTLGDAVLVPFGGKPATGYVVETANRCPEGLAGRIKPVTSRIENAAAFSQELYELAKWVAEDTFTDIRDTLRLVAPEIMTSQIRATYRLADDWERRLAGTRSPRQIEVAQALNSLQGPATASAIAKRLSNPLPIVRDGDAKPVSASVLTHSLFHADETGVDRTPHPAPAGAKTANSSSLTPVIADLRRKGVILEEYEVAQPKAKPKVVRVLSLSSDHRTSLDEAERLEKRGATRQASLLRALLANAEESSTAIPSAGLAIAPGLHAAARALSDKGLVTYFEVPVQRNPFRVFGDTKDKPPPLTDAQAAATRAIGTHLAAHDGATLLIHGVTGSGKTEVYLDAVARALALGRSALVLVPEIGLTAQLLDLFKARFEDDQVAVLHSALSHGERHDEWQRIKTGVANVVLGARSSVFAPLANLGLIVIDEEHDSSYKQDNAPRYHARDAALCRARASGAVVVLGSATPSLESYYRAQRGEYELIELAERIDSRPLPPVYVVDLRTEFKREKKAPLSPNAGGTGDAAPTTTNPEPPAPCFPKAESVPPGIGLEGGRSIFSARLEQAIQLRLERGEQTILFLNCRGFATFLLCRDCGMTPPCPNCDVSLTYHHGPRLLQCHHCDYQRRAPDTCPRCHSFRIRPFGLGTEKVEESVRRQFPSARLIRMDRDTMAKKGAHAEALRAFRKGDADILIGTQIVAKGLDFPNVTLVGVVSADTALNVPDFRSGERAFQLLTQVAGRAGRGRVPGEVIIQTFNPDHESIQRAVHHDYLGFYGDEIGHRRELTYPPFSHMANLIVTDPDDRHAQVRIEYMAGVFREFIEALHVPVHLLGPAACPLSRLRNRYRWHLVLRSGRRLHVQNVIKHAFQTLSIGDRNCLSVDIDPLTML